MRQTTLRNNRSVYYTVSRIQIPQVLATFNRTTINLIISVSELLPNLHGDWIATKKHDFFLTDGAVYVIQCY